jgi:hypothetical protein
MRVVALFILATFIPLVPFLLWLGRRGRYATPSDVASALEALLTGNGAPHAWDDFISVRLGDPALEAIRIRCWHLPKQFPPQRPGEYCSETGVEVIRTYLAQLRQMPASQGHS